MPMDLRKQNGKMAENHSGRSYVSGPHLLNETGQAQAFQFQRWKPPWLDVFCDRVEPIKAKFSTDVFPGDRLKLPGQQSGSLKVQ